MKIFLSGLVLLIGSVSASAAAPQYTLQQICTRYGNVGQCVTVPFCKQKVTAAGCALADGAPAHVEPLCKLQTQESGCKIMQSQGNCVWLEEAVATCNAKFERL